MFSSMRLQGAQTRVNSRHMWKVSGHQPVFRGRRFTPPGRLFSRNAAFQFSPRTCEFVRSKSP
jgi:hypothetical protein